MTPNHVLFSAQLWGMDPYGDPSLPKKEEDRNWRAMVVGWSSR